MVHTLVSLGKFFFFLLSPVITGKDNVMQIEQLRESARGKKLLITEYNLTSGEKHEEQITLDDGVAFLFNFLLPAHRQIGHSPNSKATIIWNGTAVIFEKRVNSRTNRERWKITVGMHLDDGKRTVVKHRIVAAFRLWGAKGIEATWNETERGGIVLYLDFPVSNGLV